MKLIKQRQTPSFPSQNLQFDGITPVAPRGLAGLLQDRFANGRLFATVGWHGGLTNISYFGDQCLEAPNFFEGGLSSAWTKLFRACVGLGSKRYYLPLKDTKLYPFGLEGQSRVVGADFKQEMFLLSDALVQRFGVLSNPRKLPVFIEMFHQQHVCAVNRPNRKWSDFKFDPELNAMIVTSLDTNPVVRRRGEESLSQKGLKLLTRDAPSATTWIAVSCDARINVRTSHHGFKLYFTSEPIESDTVSFFVVFASSKERLERRIKELWETVGDECDALVAGYEGRLLSRPRIDVGNPVLNSAFGQFPELIHSMKISDRPGAVRANFSGYFVWGWDGMTPLVPCALANEPEFTARILKFFQDTCDPKIGLPLGFSTAFQPRLREPFPAQAQYIAGLYHYVATTGDLEFARSVMPTCKFILDRCRKEVVKDTGFVSGNALWPDFPEAMDENGNDVSALNNGLLYQGLRSIEYIAGALGDAALSKECRDWARTLRASFAKYLYDEEKGYFISSCSSKDLKPRKHYPGQAIYWLTPFARELVSHAPGRIASFMDKHLRAARCLLTLPQWDTAWMADGNQLGSSYPAADFFYVNLHKLLGDAAGLKTWLGDVEWFWKHHTAPEAFTPEAENEDEFGPDNHGGKQLQAVSTWYSCLYNGVAGLDFDHEGLTVTPWSDIPVDIRGLSLRGTSIDLKIRGHGRHIGSLKLNGKALPEGSRKISWKDLKGTPARLDLVRSEKPPGHPVIVRADGLRVTSVATKSGQLTARIAGDITSEVVVQAPAKARVSINSQPVQCTYDRSTESLTIPFPNTGDLELQVDA